MNWTNEQQNNKIKGKQQDGATIEDAYWNKLQLCSARLTLLRLNILNMDLK